MWNCGEATLHYAEVSTNWKMVRICICGWAYAWCIRSRQRLRILNGNACIERVRVEEEEEERSLGGRQKKEEEEEYITVRRGSTSHPAR